MPSKEEFMELWNETVANADLSIKKITNPREFGAFKLKFIPYPTMIPIFTALDNEAKKREYLHTNQNMKKLKKWYWASIFTLNYSSSGESQATKDFVDMKEWFKDNGRIPDIIIEAQKEIADLSLKKETNQGSAIYKAILNLMTIRGVRDLITSELPEYSEVDDHHLVPDSWSKNLKEKDKINSILNKILITSDTNRKILRAKMPNEYLKEFFDKSINKDNAYKMLESHFISRRIVDILLRDPFNESDYDEFIEEREKLIRDELVNLLDIDN